MGILMYLLCPSFHTLFFNYAIIIIIIIIGFTIISHLQCNSGCASDLSFRYAKPLPFTSILIVIDNLM